MSEFQDITAALLKFRDERDWEQFHNAKDLAIALNIESSELLELFLWKSAEEADIERIKDELADILAFAFLLANKYGLDTKESKKNNLNIYALAYIVDAWIARRRLQTNTKPFRLDSMKRLCGCGPQSRRVIWVAVV